MSILLAAWGSVFQGSTSSSLGAGKRGNVMSVRWEIQRCWVGKRVKEDEEKLEQLLSEGYEPFAVTSSGQAGYTYHLRKLVGGWTK